MFSQRRMFIREVRIAFMKFQITAFDEGRFYDLSIHAKNRLDALGKARKSGYDVIEISGPVAEEETRLTVENTQRQRRGIVQDSIPSCSCNRCNECSWKNPVVSPNFKAVKWECSFCKKQLIVKLNDDTKTSSRNIPNKVRMEVWQRDRGVCVECGSNQHLEYDHVIPHSKGGSNTARNIRLLCQNCNRSKSNKI
ncbi:MAG: HNH endonuclease [Planctomycetia bacterium]|nr:HNH endonuclease [Planctomycetia bacterium]